MRTKSFRLLTVFLTVVMLIALSLNVYAAQSNAVTKDGLTAQLFTDKNAYKSGESVKATVQVENQTGREVFVFAQINVPEGVKLAGDSSAFDGLVADGAIWTTPGGTATGAVSAAGTATGDNMQAGFWVIMTALMVLGLAAMFVYGKNKKTWLSMLLCLVMLGSLGAGMIPVQAADMNGDIQLSCTIQVDGKDAEVAATISYVIYDDAEEEAADEVAPTEPSDDATDSSEGTGDDNTDSSEGTGDDNTGSSEGTGDDEQQTVVEGYKVVAATAIGHDGNKPENSYDGSFDTRWSYEGTNAWIIWELEEVKEIGYMGIAFYSGDERMSSFDILTSVDGENWTETAMSVKSDMTTDMMPVDLNEVEAKYIKFVGYGNTSNKWNSLVEVGFYPETESGEMLLPEQEDTSTDVSTLPQDIQDALEALLAIFNDDVVDFLANLYDPETGAFYYSNSARDYEGFEPNLENTKQIFAALDQWTAPGTNVQDDYLPEGYGDKLADWVYSLQDVSPGYEPYKGDGYFYHPQWGKEITGTKRNRDLSWAIQLLARFDREPMESTALDRIEGSAEAAIAVAAAVDNSNGLPDYVQSKEALEAWLAKLNWAGNPYGAGNDVNAALGSIRAAGLLEEAAAWLSGIQNTETGLWGSDISYNSLNATMKVAPIFTGAGQIIPNVDKAVDSIIWATLNLTPTIASEPFNAWNVLGSIRSQIIKVEGDLEGFEEKLYANAAAMIYKTIENIELFRQEGGFCYDYTKQSGTQQDAKAALPIVEATVNGTLLLVNGAVSSTYQALGLKAESPYGHEDLVRFMEIIQTVKAPVKIPINAQSVFDFEDGVISNAIVGSFVNGNMTIATVPTTENGDNKALAFNTVAGKSETVEISLPKSEAGEPVTIDFDIMFSGITKNKIVASSLTSNGNYAYQLLSRGEEGNASVRLGDRRYGSGDLGKSTYFTNEDNTYTTYKNDEWHKIKIVYTPPKNGADVNIRVYADNVLVQNCNRFYFTDATGAGTAKNYIDGLKFWAFSDTAGTIYIDNVMMVAGAYEDPNLCNHAMTLTEAKAATCEANGNTAYYACSKCSKYFSDASGNVVINLKDTVILGGHVYDNLLDTDCNREGCDHTRTAGMTTLDFEDVTMEKLKNKGDTNIVAGKDASNEEFKSTVSASNLNGNGSTVELVTVAMGDDADNQALAFNTKTGGGEQMDISLPLSKSMEDVTVEFKLKLGGELAAQKLGIALTNTEAATTLDNVNVMANLLVLLPSADLSTFEVYAHNSMATNVTNTNVFKDEQGNVRTYRCDEWHTFKLVYSPSNEKISVSIDETLVKEYTPTQFGTNSKTFFAYSNSKENYRESIYTAINGVRMVSYSAGAGTMYMDDIVISQQADTSEDTCAHQLTGTPAKAATCTEAGNIAYWTCTNSECGKVFKDQNGTEVITLESTVIPAGHLYDDDFDWDCNRTECGETRSITITFTETTSIQNTDRIKSHKDNEMNDTRGNFTIVEDSDKGKVLEFETKNNAEGVNELRILLPTSTAGEPVTIEYGIKFANCKSKDPVEFSLYSNGLDSDANTEQEYQILTKFDNGDATNGYNKAIWYNRNWSSNKTGFLSETFKDKNGADFTSSNGEWHKVKIVYTPPKDNKSVNIKVFVDDYETPVCDSDNSYMKLEGTNYVVKPGASINCFSIKGRKTAVAKIYIDQIKVSMGDNSTESTCIHALTETEEKAATCTETGNIAYWTCSNCGKYFVDGAGTTETTLANTVTNALTHDLEQIAATDATCTTAGTIAYWNCKREACGKKFSDEDGTTVITDVTDANQPALEHKYTDDFDMTCNNTDCDETRSVTIKFTKANITKLKDEGKFDAKDMSNGSWGVASDDTMGEVLKFETKASGSNELQILLPTSTAGKAVSVEYGIKFSNCTATNMVSFTLISNGTGTSSTRVKEYQMYATFANNGDATNGYSSAVWKDRNWTSNTPSNYLYATFKDTDGKEAWENNEWHKVKVVYTPLEENDVNIKVYIDDKLARNCDNSFLKKVDNEYVVDVGQSINCLSIVGSSSAAATVYIDQITVSMVDATATE